MNRFRLGGSAAMAISAIAIAQFRLSRKECRMEIFIGMKGYDQTLRTITQEQIDAELGVTASASCCSICGDDISRSVFAVGSMCADCAAIERHERYERELA